MAPKAVPRPTPPDRKDRSNQLNRPRKTAATATSTTTDTTTAPKKKRSSAVVAAESTLSASPSHASPRGKKGTGLGATSGRGAVQRKRSNTTSPETSHELRGASPAVSGASAAAAENTTATTPTLPQLRRRPGGGEHERTPHVSSSHHTESPAMRSSSTADSSGEERPSTLSSGSKQASPDKLPLSPNTLLSPREAKPPGDNKTSPSYGELPTHASRRGTPSPSCASPVANAPAAVVLPPCLQPGGILQQTKKGATGVPSQLVTSTRVIVSPAHKEKHKRAAANTKNAPRTLVTVHGEDTTAEEEEQEEQEASSSSSDEESSSSEDSDDDDDEEEADESDSSDTDESDDEEDSDDDDDEDESSDADTEAAREARVLRMAKRKALSAKEAALNKLKSVSKAKKKLLKTAHIAVKVSREGDRNVKLMHVLPYQTLFSDFVAGLMTRFDFKKPTDFDIFCVDANGERVDIDLDDDFEELLEPYRAYLATLDDTALADTQSRRGAVKAGSPRGASMISTTGGGGGGGGGAGGASPFGTSGTSGTSGANPLSRAPLDDTSIGLPSIALVEPLEGSTLNYIRLYVRDSYAYRKQVQQMGMSHLSQTDMTASRTMASTSEFALGRSSQSPGALLGLLSDTPDSISLQFAETHRGALGKTFTFSEREELQWSKLRTLGKGSFGTVYEGMTADGKTMAVKVQELPLDEDAEESKALQKEINLMRTLKHKNIVAYYGCQTKTQDNGATEMEIFMELCHGGSLSSLRRKFEKANERFSISLVRAYTRQILEGLAYLHHSGVMHRDIKSDNVLISAMGEAKLADFGCSKRLTTTATVGEVGAEAATKTSSSASGANAALYQTMVGSPLFMAPEVMLDDGTGYSYSADVWSVGCLVLELLGRPPWKTGNSNNVFQLMYQIAHAKSMPTGLPSNCPPALLDFFQHCFERDAKKRATAEDLLKHAWMTCADNQLEEVPPEPAA